MDDPAIHSEPTPYELHAPDFRSGKLNIGVDVRGLEVESSLRRGIGRYVLNLLLELAKRDDCCLILYGDRPPWEVYHLQMLMDLPNVRYETFFPSFAKDLNVFLLADPSPVMVGRKLLPFPLHEVPCATIFYDLIPLAFQNQYLGKNPKLRDEFLSRLDELQQVVACYLTISRFVAEDLSDRRAVPRDKIVPILGGLDEAFREPPDPDQIAETLRKYDVKGKYFFYTGGADFRKNLVTLIIAFQRLRANGNPDVKLIMTGELGNGWKEKLKDTEHEFAGDNVQALGYVDDDDLKCLYAGAVGFVFPSLYEGFGLPALEAMASRCPVIASDGSSLKEIVGDSGLLINPESDEEIAAAMQRLLSEPKLAEELRRRGEERAQKYTWRDVAENTVNALRRIARRTPRPVAKTRRMKVLIQNRDNAFIAPGGDTMVMSELYRCLRSLDVEADVAAGEPDLADVDLVHLVNLTVLDLARKVAANSMRQHVPYAVTTLFEDWPLYIERSFEAMRMFGDYLSNGRDERKFREDLKRIQNLDVGPSVGIDDVAADAAALFACGESEAKRLGEAYPRARDHVRIAEFGIRIPVDISDESQAIVREKIGYDRFILCCGRLETRKNQLMLLKALEDSDLPIILLSGGFSYQPQYVDLVSRYPRKAPVKILPRQGTPFLVNLMAAAAAHVLPSWYELPGLVTLEAASAGTAVVASDWGSVLDYLPEPLIHRCRPDDPESIRLAVENALRVGPNPDAKKAADKFTWDAFGEKTLTVYEEILSRKHHYRRPEQADHQISNSSEHSPEVTMNAPENTSRRFEASIIIPVYNRSRLTQECLEAISATNDKTSYEVIIVDNHSTDETPKLLEAIEGDVTILRQSSNRGFAAACNIGARVASGQFLVFLNNDTQPASGWLDALVSCAREDANIGAVGAKLLYPEGDVQHAGVAFNDRHIPYHIFQHFTANHDAVNEKRDMKAVTAACMLVPAALFREVGGFDEGYKNGFEDVDFCLRLGETKRRIVYCPQSTVMHREEASEGRKQFDRENLERFLAAWGNRIQPDETGYVARHGYTIVWSGGRGEYRRITQSTPQNAPEQETAMNTNSLADARELYAQGKIVEAADILQRIVESRMVLAGDDAFETWQTLGNCLASLKRTEDAEQAYHEAIKLNSNSERPYLGLGTVAMLQENWQAAMFGFMMALAKNPDTMKGEFGVGLSMAARNMHKEAMEHFRRVLEHEPFNPEALFYFYRSSMEAGEPRSAISPIEKYLQRFPDDTNFLFNLCGAYWKAGEITRAMTLCRQVLDREPGHAAARDVWENLKATMPVHA